MTPVSDSSPKYYLAINGQTQGPQTAAMILSLWRNGAVDGNTLVCQEGAQAWSTLQEMGPQLQAAVPPPAPPAGYGGAGAVAARPAQQLVIVQSGDSTKGLRLGVLLGALILFFLPWVEFQCAGQRMAYQTGVQTVLNKLSADDAMRQMAEMGPKGKSRMDNFGDKEMGEKVGHSWLAGGALLAVVIALAVAAGRSGRALSGIMAAVALGCLGMQAGLGFPLKTALERDMKKNEMGSMKMPGPDGPGDFSAGMAKGMSAMFGVKLSPWFYGELGLLAVAAALGLSGGGSGSQQRRR